MVGYLNLTRFKLSSAPILPPRFLFYLGGFYFKVPGIEWLRTRQRGYDFNLDFMTLISGHALEGNK